MCINIITSRKFCPNIYIIFKKPSSLSKDVRWCLPDNNCAKNASSWCRCKYYVHLQQPKCMKSFIFLLKTVLCEHLLNLATWKVLLLKKNVIVHKPDFYEVWDILENAIKTKICDCKMSSTFSSLTKLQWKYFQCFHWPTYFYFINAI